MLVPYIRSSSYNNWDFCQMQYYLTYVLGYTYPSGQKAEMGTIVHKVLECLAVMKKELQENKKCDKINDPQLGIIKFDPKKIVKNSFLTQSEIAKINLSRKAKSIYKTKCTVSTGHLRRGAGIVEDIFQRSFDYYQGNSVHDWKPAQRRDCHNWTWMALDYKNGMFDPRLRDIVDAEPHFDIEFDQPWAKYSHVENGQEISGKLAIKGTIDLITSLGGGILEIVDWKTGQRVDWASKARVLPVKTFDKLSVDPQLMLYYLAAQHMYPDAKAIIMTIYFIRDGGPFSLAFDEETVEMMEGLLEKRFKEITACTKPKLLDPNQKHFKCTYLCPFFKNSFEGSDKNMCTEANELISLHGIDYVRENYTREGHKISFYNAPGE